MDIFGHIHSLDGSESIEDKPIKTFTDEDNSNSVTNEDIDDNNDSIKEHENEVQEQQEERNQEVEDQEESSNDDTSAEDPYEDEAAEMSLASDYTSSDLRNMSYRQLAQILFLQYIPTKLDASDLIILDSEFVNAGDEKEGDAIGGDDDSGGGSYDSGGDSDDDFDLGFRYKPDIYTENYKEDFDTLDMDNWDPRIYVKGIANLLIRLTGTTIRHLYRIHLSFFKFCSRHLPRLITNCRVVSKLWETKLIVILPKIGDHVLDKVDITALPKPLWIKSYHTIIDINKWILINARSIVQSDDPNKVSTSISKIQQKLEDINVIWDPSRETMDLSNLKEQRIHGSIPDVGYDKNAVPALVSNLRNLGSRYDRKGLKDVSNSLKMATDIGASYYTKADKLPEKSKERKALHDKAERASGYIKQIHSIHRACIEISAFLASDFQTVMRGYEIACYKGVRDNEI